MTDIVERLRKFSAPTGGGAFCPREMAKEAADEIERLRGALFRIDQLNTDDYFFDGYQQALVKELNRALREKE